VLQKISLNKIGILIFLAFLFDIRPFIDYLDQNLPEKICKKI
jgi:hypothetical protein